MAKNGQTGPKGITEDDIEQALRLAGGIVSAAAEKLKCSDQNLRVRIAGSKRLLEVQAEVDEVVLDMAESVLLHNLKAKKLQAAIYVLDRKGGKRGFGPSMKLTGPKGGPLQVAATVERADPTTPEEIAAARRRYFNDSDDA